MKIKFLENSFYITIITIFFSIFFLFKVTSLDMNHSLVYLFSNDSQIFKEYSDYIERFHDEGNIILLASTKKDSLKEKLATIKPIIESFDELVEQVHLELPDEFSKKNYFKLIDQDSFKHYKRIFYDPNLVPFFNSLNSAIEDAHIYNNYSLTSNTSHQEVIDLLGRLYNFIDIKFDFMNGEYDSDLAKKAVDHILFNEELKFSNDKESILFSIQPKLNSAVPLKSFQEKINEITKIITNVSSKYGVEILCFNPYLNNFNNVDLIETLLIALIIIIITLLILLSIYFYSIRLTVLCFTISMLSFIWSLGIFYLLFKTINIILIVSLLACIIIFFILNTFAISDLLYLKSNNVSIHNYVKKFFLMGSVISILFITHCFMSNIKIITMLDLIVGLFIAINFLLIRLFMPILLNQKYKTILDNNSFCLRFFKFIKRIGDHHSLVKKIGLLTIFTIFLLSYHFSRNNIKHIVNDIVDLGIESNYNSDKIFQNYGYYNQPISTKMNNLDEMNLTIEKLRELESVGYIESITDYLPNKDNSPERFRFVSNLRREMVSREIRKQFSKYDMLMCITEMKKLEASVIEIQEYALFHNQKHIYDKTAKLVGVVQDTISDGILTSYINYLSNELPQQKLALFQEKFSTELKSTILKISNNDALYIDNLPAELDSRFKSSIDDSYRVNIYPNINIYSSHDNLNKFIEDVSSVLNHLHGTPYLLYQFRNNIKEFLSLDLLIYLFLLFLITIIISRDINISLLSNISVFFNISTIIIFITLLGIDIKNTGFFIVSIFILFAIIYNLYLLVTFYKIKGSDVLYKNRINLMIISVICSLILVSFSFKCSEIQAVNIVCLFIFALVSNIISSVFITILHNYHINKAKIYN